MDDPKRMTDGQVLDGIRSLAGCEQLQVVHVIRLLMEMDKRGLHSREAYPSLYEFCVQDLGFAEATAFHRIRVARAARKFPKILGMLEAGELTLEAVVRLHPHLDQEKGPVLLEQAKGKTKREVEAIVAVYPEPPKRDFIRAVGTRVEPAAVDNGGLFPEGEAKPTIAERITSTLVRFAFDADDELRRLVERARELLRHKYPNGRLEHIFKEALQLLLDKRDPARKNALAEPRPSTGRHRDIPQWVKDRVTNRDEGKCAFVSESGKRCGSADGVEFDHVTPWAHGGKSDEVANIRLLCRGHNRHEAARRGLL
jgi:hypothetical protein